MATGAGLADDGGTNKRSIATLRAGFAASKADPGHNQFARPLYMDSSEGENGVAGEIFGVGVAPVSRTGYRLDFKRGEVPRWALSG
jgi:hypothetical protein